MNLHTKYLKIFLIFLVGLSFTNLSYAKKLTATKSEKKSQKQESTQAKKVCLGYKNTVVTQKEHCLNIKLKEDNDLLKIFADCSEPIPKFPIIFNKITLKYHKKSDHCQVKLDLKTGKTKKLDFKGNKDLLNPDKLQKPKPTSKSL